MTNASPILNVAVVGCGEIAMVAHLPTLLLCSDKYRTVALVDISRQTLAHCATKFHVPHTYTDIAEMLRSRPEVDLVVIANANEYHVEHAVQSLEAGKHILIEKPMSLTRSGAQRVIQAQKASGKLVFVGYMRRYATAFLRVKELVQALEPGKIQYVRVRDIIGWNHFFVEQSGTFPKKFTDFPAGAGAERESIGNALFDEALGVERSADPKLRRFWGLMNGLATHDLSAMREILGMPQSVAYAKMNGFFINVIFHYDGFQVLYEVGIDNVKEFDAHIKVYATDCHIKIDYDTPYVKALPIVATVKSTKPNGDHSVELIRPTYEDPYTLELLSLYESITTGAPVKTSAEDAALDLEILHMTLDALQS